MKSVSNHKTTRLALSLNSDPVAKQAGCNSFVIETRPSPGDDYRYNPQKITMTHKEAVAVASFLNESLDLVE
ncbi:MAG: hypothetical protein CME70_14080 [Halobacteriovorax sp.]|nr:hypothetical protein [Halobacteriovorax sp.]